MTKNTYPGHEQAPTPLEQLHLDVDALFPPPEAGSVEPQQVIRYIGGQAERKIWFTRDVVTGDTAIEYKDPGPSRSTGMRDYYGQQHLSLLTGDGRLFDTSGVRRPASYDHEKEYAPDLLEALQQSTPKPLGTLGRLILAYRIYRQEHAGDE